MRKVLETMSNDEMKELKNVVDNEKRTVSQIIRRKERSEADNVTSHDG
jgi:hypothetical protein